MKRLFFVACAFFAGAICLMSGFETKDANACRTNVDLGQFTFNSHGSCLQVIAKTRLWLSNTEADLYEQYQNAFYGCESAADRQIACVGTLTHTYNAQSIRSVQNALRR